uniref:Retrovirus-related Pol polyprotein LINE-1 n=1 Tax=Tanacetum cinerariifolium TaxID=118510 RepID=A0A6L2MWR0_TANCI|nr:retrovirus-related Pol polyprotein LINE-1 [Tanacetum cinerariifolium]
MDIRIRDQILQPKESFRYLGSVLHRSGRIVDDVAHRIRAGWMKWKAASGILCDKRIPLKLKGKFYRATIRPAMLYGSECWQITKALAFRVEVAELRMLREACIFPITKTKSKSGVSLAGVGGLFLKLSLRF